jgi:hypothetical protein
MPEKAQTLSRSPELRSAQGQPKSYVHLLPLDRELSDFLRLTLGITQANVETALAIKEEVEARLERFTRESLWRLNRHGMRP